jgi:hypothetical protein
MVKIYIDLEVIAHLFMSQQLLEKEHRDRVYVDSPDKKEMVRLEVSSALGHCFHKVVSVAQMTNDIPEYDLKRLRDMTYSGESAGQVKSKRSYILK